MARQILIITYHYIRELSSSKAFGIYPITPKDFRNQITMISQNLEIVTPELAETILNNPHDDGPPVALLTFDDALLDQQLAANEVLSDFDIKAIFFTCTNPLESGNALNVNKIQWLRSMLGQKEFNEKIKFLLNSKWGQSKSFEEYVVEAKVNYVHDSAEDATVKYLLNYIVPNKIISSITNTLLSDLCVSEQEFCDFTYISRNGLKELHDHGHTIGAHTHTHVPVSSLKGHWSSEITRNLDGIEAITGDKPRWFAYPYGRQASLPLNTQKFKEDSNFLFCVTMNPGWASSASLSCALPRIDTNEVEKYLKK